MGLRVRTITPYALPGVLALLACWWFFSRKKDRRSTKHDHVCECVEKVEADDALQEILREDSSSRAQLVQLNTEEDIVLQENCTHSLPLGAQKPSLYSSQSLCKVEDDFGESHIETVIVGSLQGSADQKIVEDESPDNLRANEVSEVQDAIGLCTSSVLSQSLDENKAANHNFDTAINDEKVNATSTEEPCGCNCVGDIQDIPLTVIRPQGSIIDSDLLEVPSPTESLDKNILAVKEQSVPSYGNEIQVVDISPLPQAASAESSSRSKEVELQCSEPSGFKVQAGCVQNPVLEIPSDYLKRHELYHSQSENPFSCCENIEIKQSDTTSAVSVKGLGVQPFVAEMQEGIAGSHIVKCCQSTYDENGLVFECDVKICDIQSSESVKSETLVLGNALNSHFPMAAKDDILQGEESVTEVVLSENCVKSSITEVVKEGDCSSLLDAFSKCLEKTEEFESSCPIVDSLKEANAKSYLGDYEAKIVEQLAINIISKVIVAARQEILSSSVSDMSAGSCQVPDESKDTQSKHFVPERDEDSISANLTLGLLDFECACDSSQSKPLQNKDFTSTELTSYDFCREHKLEEHNIAPNASIHQVPVMSDFSLSPVQRKPDFFEESQPALEDSSLSVCTSEEGINMEDPLQSTVLSTVSMGYDSMSSSGIELSRETFNMSIEKPKNATHGENDKEHYYTNGDIKRGSPDLNNEGHLTAESEVDHSGGSDVNSMDSVDSGCALGSSEQFQNGKEKAESKKADLVIWEFEVPKYLVGRLIGKQGRFVSFLKQSSGAKIYISTVPYTQDIQICHLEGSQQQIDRALSLIRKKFKDLNLTNIFAPPPPLIPLPVASWLTLPNNVSVEVVVVNVVNAGHMFVQQRTHPTFHALCGLDQHMSLCYSQPEIPSLPTPAEVGILCAAPVGPSVWWRAQVMAYFEDTEEVEILYVDYGGYNRVKIETLRQIRSDFVSLPFQGVEVLLDNVIPLGDEDHFSADADAAVKELTRGAPMLTQVTNYDEATRLPLVQLWRLNPDEMVSVNRTLVEKGFAEWIDGY